METKTVTISSDYYVYIMKDILSRFENLVTIKDQDVDIRTKVLIPETSICVNNEIISLTKSDDKIMLTSNVHSCVNYLEKYPSLNYLFKDTYNNIIGTHPPSDKEQIDEINKHIRYLNSYRCVNETTAINWQIIFSTKDFNTVEMEFVREDLLDVYNINWDTIDLFLPRTVASKFRE